MWNLIARSGMSCAPGLRIGSFPSSNAASRLSSHVRDAAAGELLATVIPLSITETGLGSDAREEVEDRLTELVGDRNIRVGEDVRPVLARV